MSALYHEGFTQNRDISWLRFNERILEEADDRSVPLLERLRYISIFTKNLDEFYMVRVGELINDIASGDADKVDRLSGLTMEEQIKAIDSMASELLERKDRIYSDLMGELDSAGLIKLEYDMLTPEERKTAYDYFEEKVRPLLHEMILDSTFPAGELESAPYIIGMTETESGPRFCIACVPKELPPILELKSSPSGEVRYMLLETLIKGRFNDIFEPFVTSDVMTMVITRNSDVDVEDSGDLLKDMKKVVRMREKAEVNRVVVDRKPGAFVQSFLTESLKLRDWQVYVTKRASFDFVDALTGCIINDPDEVFLYRRFTPFNIMNLRNERIIDLLRREELLLAYPYDSMDPFLTLLEEASADDRVREIRMTIYRLAGNSSIAEHLMNAASNGKKVKLMIELRARFDESRNIEWVEKLKKAGCIVKYVNDDYKVHCKLCQMKLHDNGRDYYITQLGTGNYNEKSARQYTDLSLITCDDRIGRDAERFFKDLFAGRLRQYEHIAVSPVQLADTVTGLIRREASKGSDGRIFIKCNSLGDEDIMEELMLASQRGCRITLLVRGICCMLPGIKDCTENVRIVNLVGRFLEHSRVYIFGSGVEETMYISSADIMKRNMHRRVELACPIYSAKLRDRIRAIMYLNVRDNVKGRVMLSDGSYVRKQDNKEIIDSQKILIKYTAVN